MSSLGSSQFDNPPKSKNTMGAKSMKAPNMHTTVSYKIKTLSKKSQPSHAVKNAKMNHGPVAKPNQFDEQMIEDSENIDNHVVPNRDSFLESLLLDGEPSAGESFKQFPIFSNSDDFMSDE